MMMMMGIILEAMMMMDKGKPVGSFFYFKSSLNEKSGSSQVVGTRQCLARI